MSKNKNKIESICHICGEEFYITPKGATKHTSEEDEDGFDMDSNHVPYSLKDQ